jgi:hypothetical protein
MSPDVKIGLLVWLAGIVIVCRATGVPINVLPTSRRRRVLLVACLLAGSAFALWRWRSQRPVTVAELRADERADAVCRGVELQLGSLDSTLRARDPDVYTQLDLIHLYSLVRNAAPLCMEEPEPCVARMADTDDRAATIRSLEVVETAFATGESRACLGGR